MSTYFCRLIVNRVLNAADCFSSADASPALAKHGLAGVLQTSMLQQLLPVLRQRGNSSLNRPPKVRHLEPASYLFLLWTTYLGSIALAPMPVTEVGNFRLPGLEDRPAVVHLSNLEAMPLHHMSCCTGRLVDSDVTRCTAGILLQAASAVGSPAPNPSHVFVRCGLL